MNNSTAVPETLTVEEVAACAALVGAQDLDHATLAQDDFPAYMMGLSDAIGDEPLSDAEDRGLNSYMTLLAATWILESLPDDTRIPVCPSLQYALKKEPGLLELARRFLAGQTVSVPSIKW